MTKTPTRVGRGPGRMAEDRGFEPLRAVNPTRIPSVRHRPLGESSVGNYTGSRAAARPSGKRARPGLTRSPRPEGLPEGAEVPAQWYSALTRYDGTKRDNYKG